MAQGKLKVKAKLPESVQKKKRQNTSQKSNRPIKPKKQHFEESHKLKKLITKTLNKSVEEEMRSRASGNKNLSKVQQAVAAHNSKK